MDYFKTWNEAITHSIQNIWAKVASFIPELVGALLILIIGLLIASLLGKVVKKLVNYTHVDKIFHKLGIANRFENLGITFNVGGLVGWIVKWFFVVVTLIAAVDVLHLPQVTSFLQDVALYIPNVMVAVIILVIGLIIGQFAFQLVDKSAKAYHLTASSSEALAAITKWAIVIFSFMASLSQLNIATHLIEILFQGFVAMLAISFGLAFGLGGKEKAGKFLDNIDRKHM